MNLSEVQVFEKKKDSKLSCDRLALISITTDMKVRVKYWNFYKGCWNAGTKRLTLESFRKNYKFSHYGNIEC